MDRKEPNNVSPLLRRWAVAATAASMSEFVTFPLDGRLIKFNLLNYSKDLMHETTVVTKTRLQLQNELGADVVLNRNQLGMFRTGLGIYHSEGLQALYKGLPAAVLRQAVYGGIGVGLYQPVRRLVCGDTDPKTAPIWKRVLAGGITGATGQFVATPTDVVKIRLQADGKLERQGLPRRYRGTLDAFSKIYREQGLAGFMKGLGPSIQRAAVINGCGIASYDFSKQTAIAALRTSDGLAPQLLASLVSGLISAVVSNPFDVVKTRLMNQDRSMLYKGPIDCLVKSIRAEGIFCLYKGFIPAYSRLAPWQLTFFIAFERLNIIFNGETI